MNQIKTLQTRQTITLNDTWVQVVKFISDNKQENDTRKFKINSNTEGTTITRTA